MEFVMMQQQHMAVTNSEHFEQGVMQTHPQQAVCIMAQQEQQPQAPQQHFLPATGHLFPPQQYLLPLAPPADPASPAHPPHGAMVDPASGVSPGQCSVDSGYVYSVDFSPASVGVGVGVGPLSVSSNAPPMSAVQSAVDDDAGFVGSPAMEPVASRDCPAARDSDQDMNELERMLEQQSDTNYQRSTEEATIDHDNESFLTRPPSPGESEESRANPSSGRKNTCIVEPRVVVKIPLKAVREGREKNEELKPICSRKRHTRQSEEKGRSRKRTKQGDCFMQQGEEGVYPEDIHSQFPRAGEDDSSRCRRPRDGSIRPEWEEADAARRSDHRTCRSDHGQESWRRARKRKRGRKGDRQGQKGDDRCRTDGDSNSEKDHRESLLSPSPPFPSQVLPSTPIGEDRAIRREERREGGRRAQEKVMQNHTGSFDKMRKDSFSDEHPSSSDVDTDDTVHASSSRVAPPEKSIRRGSGDSNASAYDLFTCQESNKIASNLALSLSECDKMATCKERESRRDWILDQAERLQVRSRPPPAKRTRGRVPYFQKLQEALWLRREKRKRGEQRNQNESANGPSSSFATASQDAKCPERQEGVAGAASPNKNSFTPFDETNSPLDGFSAQCGENLDGLGDDGAPEMTTTGNDEGGSQRSRDLSTPVHVDSQPAQQHSLETSGGDDHEGGGSTDFDDLLKPIEEFGENDEGRRHFAADVLFANNDGAQQQDERYSSMPLFDENMANLDNLVAMHVDKHQQQQQDHQVGGNTALPQMVEDDSLVSGFSVPPSQVLKPRKEEEGSLHAFTAAATPLSAACTDTIASPSSQSPFPSPSHQEGGANEVNRWPNDVAPEPHRGKQRRAIEEGTSTEEPSSSFPSDARSDLKALRTAARFRGHIAGGGKRNRESSAGADTREKAQQANFCSRSDESDAGSASCAAMRNRKQSVKPNKGPSMEDVEVSVVHEGGVDDQWLECAVEGCKFWTKKPARMRRHERCHVGSRYQCPDCGKRFFSLPKMLRHDRRHHTPQFKDYECRLCGAEVTDLAVHNKVHREERPHKCAVCRASFKHKNSLVRHLVMHSGQLPFMCRFCRRKFASDDQLKDHVELEHGPNDQEEKGKAEKVVAKKSNRKSSTHDKQSTPVSAPPTAAPTFPTTLVHSGAPILMWDPSAGVPILPAYQPQQLFPFYGGNSQQHNSGQQQQQQPQQGQPLLLQQPQCFMNLPLLTAADGSLSCPATPQTAAISAPPPMMTPQHSIAVNIDDIPIVIQDSTTTSPLPSDKLAIAMQEITGCSIPPEEEPQSAQCQQSDASTLDEMAILTPPPSTASTPSSRHSHVLEGEDEGEPREKKHEASSRQVVKESSERENERAKAALEIKDVIFSERRQHSNEKETDATKKAVTSKVFVAVTTSDENKMRYAERLVAGPSSASPTFSGRASLETAEVVDAEGGEQQKFRCECGHATKYLRFFNSHRKRCSVATHKRS